MSQRSKLLMLAIFIPTLLVELTQSSSLASLMDELEMEYEHGLNCQEIGKTDCQKRWSPSEVRVDEFIQQLGKIVQDRTIRQRTNRRERFHSLDDADVSEPSPSSEYSNNYDLFEPTNYDQGYSEGANVLHDEANENDIPGSMFRGRVRREDSEPLLPSTGFWIPYGDEKIWVYPLTLGSRTVFIPNLPVEEARRYFGIETSGNVNGVRDCESCGEAGETPVSPREEGGSVETSSHPPYVGIAMFIPAGLMEQTQTESFENRIAGTTSDSVDMENELSMDSNELGRGDRFKRWAPSEIRVDELIQKLGSLINPARQNKQRTRKRKRSHSLDDARVVETFFPESSNENNNDYLFLEPAIDDGSDSFIDGNDVPNLANENEHLASPSRGKTRREDGGTARTTHRSMEVLKRNTAATDNYGRTLRPYIGKRR